MQRLFRFAALAAVGWSIGCTSSSTARVVDWPDRGQPARVPLSTHGNLAHTPAEQTPVRLRQPTRVAVPIEGSELVRGRSSVIVEAPIDVVRKTVLDYRRYPEFMPHYRATKVLRRTRDGGREVYMQWVALHGVIKLWARLEMSGAHTVDGYETYESSFIDGNVKTAVAVWRLKSVSDSQTELSLEVFLHPKLPVPDQLLNDENLDAAFKGVSAMRERCEAAAR